MRADGTPVLLDFGAARRAVAEMSRTLTGIVKAGYSPHEQYSSDGRLQGPWSDIYALGGTLYRAVTGQPPEEATLRVDEDHMPPAAQAAKGSYRPGFLAAIDACLKVRHSERPRSVAQLRPMLLGQTPQPQDEVGRSLQAPDARASRTPGGSPPTGPRRLGGWPLPPPLAVVLGGAYGGYEYTRWQPAEPGMRDAEAKQLAALIEVRRKEAADAAQRQVELEAEQRRKEAARPPAGKPSSRQNVGARKRRRPRSGRPSSRQSSVSAKRRQRRASRQAELEAERQRKEAAEAARRQAELEEERQRKEAAEAARKQAEIDAERQRKEAADAARRQAELEENGNAKRPRMLPAARLSSTKSGGGRRRWSEWLLRTRPLARPPPKPRRSARRRSAAGLLHARRQSPAMTRPVAKPRPR